MECSPHERLLCQVHLQLLQRLLRQEVPEPRVRVLIHEFETVINGHLFNELPAVPQTLDLVHRGADVLRVVRVLHYLIHVSAPHLRK